MSLLLKFFIKRNLKIDIILILKLLQVIYALILSINVYLVTLILIKNSKIFWRYFKERIKSTSSKTLAKRSS